MSREPLNKNPDAAYKTCIYCGKKWNVSVKNIYDNYICPVCRTKLNHKIVERS